MSELSNLISKKLRVGVIGLGVGEQHIIGFNKHPNAVVTKICDFNKDKLIDVHSRNKNCETTINSDKIIKDPNIDVVSIASFDEYHCDQILLALENNKHVFVEKPLCLLRPEYEKIVSKYKEKKILKLSSNLILRLAPRFQNLKNKISAGMLGNTYLYEASYDYGRINKIINGWRGKTKNYSVMHGGGIHLIDLILWITGKKVLKVNALGKKIATANSEINFPDCISAQLEFEDGSIGNIIANFPSVTAHGHRLVIHGDKGTFHHGPLGSAYFFTRDPLIKPELNNEPYPGVNKGDLIYSFVDNILGNGTCAISSYEVFNAMNISLAIEESLVFGESVKIKNLDC